MMGVMRKFGWYPNWIRKELFLIPIHEVRKDAFNGQARDQECQSANDGEDPAKSGSCPNVMAKCIDVPPGVISKGRQINLERIFDVRLIEAIANGAQARTDPDSGNHLDNLSPVPNSRIRRSLHSERALLLLSVPYN